MVSHDPACLLAKVVGTADGGFDRVEDRPWREHHRDVHSVVVRSSEQETGWPVVPAPGLVGVAVFGDDRIASEPVDEPGAIVVLDAQALGRRKQLTRELYPLAEVRRRQQPGQDTYWFQRQMDDGRARL